MSTTADRIVAFVEKPKDPPGHARQPRPRARLDGHLCLPMKFLADQLTPRRRRPELQPRFRQGHHSLYRQARQGGGASLPNDRCVRSAQEKPRIGATSAPSMLIGKPTSTSPTSCRSSTSTTTTGRSGPIAEITPPAKFVHDIEGRRGQAVSSLVSGGCIVSGAALERSLLFTGVRVNSFAAIEERA